jgi:ribose transport system ATP-binding protein
MSSKAPEIRLRNLTKLYAGVAALSNVSLDVAPATIHCLVGGNGSGKSTLVKVLAGVEQGAKEGTVALGGRTVPADEITPAWSYKSGLRFVHQDKAIFPDISIRDNLAAGRPYPRGRGGNIRWSALDRHCRDLLERFDICASPRTPAGNLRPAQATQLAIARALQDDEEASNTILVLDEPTAALPPEEAERLLEVLREYRLRGHTILLVSHHLDDVAALADTATVLKDGCVLAALTGSTITRDRLVALMGGAVRAATRPGASCNTADAVRRLVATKLTAPGLGPLDLEVAPGEIVGLAGLEGSGQDRLLRVLAGVTEPAGGELLLDGQRHTGKSIRSLIRSGVAYVAGNRDEEALFLELTVRENLTADNVGRYRRYRAFLDRDAERAAVMSLVRDFDIRMSSLEQPAITLSGGNRQKVALARAIGQAARLILLDEPTQGVDVKARSDIHDIIRAQATMGAAVVFASSDAEELLSLATRILVLGAGRIVNEIGNDAINARTIARAVHSGGRE